VPCSGVLVAHGSGSADRETVDRNDHVRVPPGEESYHIRRVWLSEEEQGGYYYGFSNEGLWPLCHVAHTRPNTRADVLENFAVGGAVFQRASGKRGRPIASTRLRSMAALAGAVVYLAAGLARA